MPAGAKKETKGAGPQKTASRGSPGGEKREKPAQAAAKAPAARTVVKGKSVGQKLSGASGDGVQLYQSSDARQKWSEVLRIVAEGGKVAILYGTRAFAFREVELTYAEREYGVTKDELDAKADEIEQRGIEEIRAGKARRVI